ncbi:MAG: hypothetical protein KF896_15870 [Ignavibacteriae bacterium]|nr:hypothetical protein [Ignavibacteriota bacterium]MBX3045190.1 hypothetical protein [Ignavibacteriota bacterium]
MNNIKFIAKHINYDSDKIVDCDAVCAFTGEKITKGIKKKVALSGNFTDFEYLKFESDYISVDAFKCLGEMIQTEKKLNSLRNFSYFVSETELKILKKDEIWDIIINTPNAPFILAYTFSSKKHTTFKSKITTDKNKIQIITDTYGNVEIDKILLKDVIGIVQNWYSGTADMPAIATFFTKDEILTGSDNFKKITTYGIEKFSQEDKILAKFRNTPQLFLLTRLVNKCVLK